MIYINKKTIEIINFNGFCDPTGARTQDPNIKSVVLYQLSYRVKMINKIMPF